MPNTRITPEFRSALERANSAIDRFEARIDRLASTLPYPHPLPSRPAVHEPVSTGGYRSVGRLKISVLDTFAKRGFAYHSGGSGHGTYALTKPTSIAQLSTMLTLDTGRTYYRCVGTWGIRYAYSARHVFPAAFTLPLNSHGDLSYPLIDLRTWQMALENLATSVQCVETLLLPKVVSIYSRAGAA